MGYSNDEERVVKHGVDNGMRESSEHKPAQVLIHRSSAVWVLQEQLDDAVYLRAESETQSSHFRFVPCCLLNELLLRVRMIRSSLPQANTQTLEYNRSGHSFNLALNEFTVAALRLLQPRLLNTGIGRAVELRDQGAEQFFLLGGAKRLNILVEFGKRSCHRDRLCCHYASVYRQRFGLPTHQLPIFWNGISLLSRASATSA